MRAPIDLSADLHGHVLEYVSDTDRAWFERHPGRTSYSRPPVAHEFCDPGQLPRCSPPPMPPHPGDKRWKLAVQVDLLDAGVRARQPYWVEVTR